MSAEAVAYMENLRRNFIRYKWMLSSYLGPSTCVSFGWKRNAHWAKCVCNRIYDMILIESQAIRRMRNSFLVLLSLQFWIRWIYFVAESKKKKKKISVDSGKSELDAQTWKITPNNCFILNVLYSVKANDTDGQRTERTHKIDATIQKNDCCSALYHWYLRCICWCSFYELLLIVCA